jgi:hypothetical protein
MLVTSRRRLDYFTSEDRHQAYKKLCLSILVHPGGDLEVTGILKQPDELSKNGGTSRSTARKRLKGRTHWRGPWPREGLEKVSVGAVLVDDSGVHWGRERSEPERSA